MGTVALQVQGYFEAARPVGVAAAYLFGSHARGTAHRESDVDVAVLLDHGVFPERGARAREAVRLCTELVAAAHANRVDVVVLNDAPPELAAAVVSRGRRLYCPDEAADHAFVRTALLRHGDIRPFLERMRRVKLRALSR
jgi:predicted nucleotidyltransferase